MRIFTMSWHGVYDKLFGISGVGYIIAPAATPIPYLVDFGAELGRFYSHHELTCHFLVVIVQQNEDKTQQSVPDLSRTGKRATGLKIVKNII